MATPKVIKANFYGNETGMFQPINPTPPGPMPPNAPTDKTPAPMPGPTTPAPGPQPAPKPPQDPAAAPPTNIAMPNMQNPSVALGNLQGPQAYIDPRLATVEGRLPGLLNQNSDYMKAARYQTDLAGNQKGLLNSAMTATGGTLAGIMAANDIATKDAALYGSAALKNQDTYNQGLLSNQAAGISQNLARSNTQLTAALNNQSYSNMSNLQKLQFNQARILKEMDLTADQQNLMATLMSSQTNTIMNNIGDLLGNPDIKMNDNVVSWLSDFMYEAWKGIGDLFKMDVKVV